MQTAHKMMPPQSLSTLQAICVHTKGSSRRRCKCTATEQLVRDRTRTGNPVAGLVLLLVPCPCAFVPLHRVHFLDVAVFSRLDSHSKPLQLNVNVFQLYFMYTFWWLSSLMTLSSCSTCGLSR